MNEMYLMCLVLRVCQEDLNFRLVLVDPMHKKKEKVNYNLKPDKIYLPVILWHLKHLGYQGDHLFQEDPIDLIITELLFNK